MSFSENSTDEELMAAYQEGNYPAFEILFRRHSARVYGFLLGKIGNRAQAEDIFQSAFLKLHKSRNHYDPSFPFLPWLFTIAKSVLIDQVRKEKTIREDSNSEVVAAAPSPEIIETTREVDTSSLPALQQNVLSLRYRDDLSFEEIAKRLDTSPSNIRQLLSRGIRKLRKNLGGNKSDT